MSKGIKLLLYLLTSPELGYQKVSIEHQISEAKSVDLYIEEKDLSIEWDGPVHYFANTGERK